MKNIKKLTLLAAAGALLFLAANAQAQQSTSTSETDFVLNSKLSPQEVAQAFLDAVYTGDSRKASVAAGGAKTYFILASINACLKNRAFAQEWGAKPVKYTIERVEVDFDLSYVHCHSVLGIKPQFFVSMDAKGIWYFNAGDAESYSFDIALPGDEKEWKEGSPQKVALAWFNAIAAEDWEKANAVCVENLRRDNADILRRLKKANKSGKDIPPVTGDSIDYMNFDASGNAVAQGYAELHCSTAGEKYTLVICLQKGVWLVDGIGNGWPTNKFWKTP